MESNVLMENPYHRRILQEAYDAKPGVLSDEQIKLYKIVDPCVDSSPKGVVSYGLTSYGYDARLDRKFKIFTNALQKTIDPKAFDPDCFIEREGDFCIVPPNSFVLGVTVERFRIPRGVISLCLGKSTYARCGIIVNVTPLEPEWEGKVTLEISNTTPLPAKVYANEGIAQFLFFRGSFCCHTSYKDKQGRYQNQTDITLPFVK